MKDDKMKTEEQKAQKASYHKQYYQDHKAEMAARGKKYYESHKVEKYAYNKQYQQDHNAEMAVYMKQYKQNNKDNIAAQIKQYKQNHKAEIDVYIKQWYQDHKTEIIEYNKQWHQDNKAKCRNYQLQRTYGIELKEYNELFAAQEGKCVICGKHQSEFKRALCVDHNHDTGEVRGLLCQQCNSVLGYANDNPKILGSSTKYLLTNILRIVV